MISVGSTASAFGEGRQADERQADGVAAPTVVPAGAVPPIAAPVGPPVLSPDDPRHGTVNGYNNLKCRCQPCRDAWAAFNRASRQRRRAEVEAGRTLRHDPRAGTPVHGSDSCYRNWSCRCRPCTDAHAAEYRDYLRRRRASSGEAFALDLEPPPGLGSNTAGGSGSNGTANATVHEGTARRSRSRGAEPSAAAVPQT